MFNKTSGVKRTAPSTVSFYPYTMMSDLSNSLSVVTFNSYTMIKVLNSLYFGVKINTSCIPANIEFSKSRLKGSVQRVELPRILVRVDSRGCLSPYGIGFYTLKNK